MCGRYSLTAPEDELVEIFEVPAVPELPLPLPRFNVAPSQVVPSVVLGPEGRRMGPLQWGLVPWWSDDPRIGNRLINARSESAHRTPAFRDAFARHRCLIPADGFYEWQRPTEKNGPKRPHWIHRPDRRPFAFAGLWDRWRSDDDAEPPLLTFTILTASAPEWMQPIHDRMPVVVPSGSWDRWMDPATSVEDARRLLEGTPVESMEATEVSTRVNRPAYDDPECLEPLA